MSAMLNRFSTDIATGDVCYPQRMADSKKWSLDHFLIVTKEHVKIIIRLFSKCHSGGGEESRRFFLNLLQFPLPYGTANNPENVSKK
jgi:hypothetical protein